MQGRPAHTEHLGRCSYSLKDCVWIRITGFGIFNDFAIVHPVGALDGKVGLRQIAAEHSRGLVANLGRFSNDVWGLR